MCTRVWEALSYQSVLDELLKRKMTALLPSVAGKVRGDPLADGLWREVLESFRAQWSSSRLGA